MRELGAGEKELLSLFAPSSPAGRGGRLPGSEVEILELREETPTSRGRGASRRAGKKRR